MTGLMLFVTTTLGGISFVMLYKLTGGLWFPMATHFVNNSVINLLHVVTVSGADELQAIRIAIAQTIMGITVFTIYLLNWRKNKAKERTEEPKGS
jgi:membrane protease YdiL (CAAX protease family)